MESYPFGSEVYYLPNALTRDEFKKWTMGQGFGSGSFISFVPLISSGMEKNE